MTQIRCKYFDESGNPRTGGCRSMNCGFVHPDNPAWERALIPRSTPREPARGGFRGRAPRGSFQGDMRGRGRGRGSTTIPSHSTPGWGDANGADAHDSGFETGSAKDSIKDNGTGWGTGVGWGSSNNPGGGWGGSTSPGPWGTAGWGDSSTTSKEPSGGGWGSSSPGPWGTAGWGDSGTASKEPSGGGWDNSSPGPWGSIGWGESSTGSKESSGWGWGTSGEMTQPAQEKRDTREKDVFKSPTVPPSRPTWGASSGWGSHDGEEETKTVSRPIKKTGTNQIPLVGSRWNRNENTTTHTNPGPSEKPRVSPLQTSSLGNWTSGEPSATGSERDYTDVEKPLQKEKTMSVKSGSISPSVSTLTAPSAIHKRKFSDSDLEKQQEAWRNFIRLFDRAVRAKAGFDKAETERQSWVRTQKSTTYERIGEAGRIRLDGHRVALETARKSHGDKLTQAISELAEAGERLTSGIDYDERYDIEGQVMRYLNEVGAWLGDIRPLLIANTSQHPSNADDPLSHENRLSEETCVNPDGLDPLRARLDKQEELLEELRTALTLGPSKDVLATVNNRIDGKIAAMCEAAKMVPAEVPPKVVIPPEVMCSIEDVSLRATTLSTAMEKPVNDIAHLLIHQDEMRKMYTSFETENKILKESMTKLTEMSAANRELIQAQTATIQRLKASLESASESRRTPPPTEPAVKIMFEDLRTAVDNMVQDIISREVVPAVSQMSDACRTENQRIHREIFEVIWDRVEPALKLTEAVNRCVTRFDIPAS